MFCEKKISAAESVAKARGNDILQPVPEVSADGFTEGIK